MPSAPSPWCARFRAPCEHTPSHASRPICTGRREGGGALGQVDGLGLRPFQMQLVCVLAWAMRDGLLKRRCGKSEVGAPPPPAASTQPCPGSCPSPKTATSTSGIWKTSAHRYVAGVQLSRRRRGVETTCIRRRRAMNSGGTPGWLRWGALTSVALLLVAGNRGHHVARRQRRAAVRGTLRRRARSPPPSASASSRMHAPTDACEGQSDGRCGVLGVAWGGGWWVRSRPEAFEGRC